MVNLDRLRMCLEIYHQENKVWPDKNNWCNLIKPYVEEEKTRNWFLCPEDKVGPCSYAMNKNIPADVNDLPPDLVLLFESTPGWNRTGGPEDVITGRHKKTGVGANIAFAEGHVKFVPIDKIPALRWTIETSLPADVSK